MSTTAQLVSEFSALAGTLDLNALDSLDPEDFIAFGLQTSHEYRKQLMKLYNDASVTPQARAYIMFLTIMVKSKDRIMRAITTEQFQARFSSNPEMMQAVQFISEFTEQSTKHPDVIASRKFPLVNIPTCMPNLALFIFLAFRMKALDFQAKTDNQRIEELFEPKNTFMVQMNLAPDLQDVARQQNIKFWNDVVKKSKVDGGRNYERGWNEEYYNTQAADSYPILERTSTSFTPKVEIITRDRLKNYVMSMRIA